MRRCAFQCSAACAVLVLAGVAFGQMSVEATSPLINAGGVARTAPIVIDFDRPVDRATFVSGNFSVFGKWSGPVPGTLSFSNGDQTVTFTPSRLHQAGEVVITSMSHNLRGSDGVALRPAGYTLSFLIGTRPTPKFFRERAVISNRDSTGAQTRIYGGLACDFNFDGFSDLATINEVSADIRVMMNRGDGSGLFQPMLTPYNPIPFESSPNEAADFNGDGLADIVTSSNATNQMAVCLGIGGGRFAPAAIYNTGGYPRGFGIMDIDGDGDKDITVAQASANNIAIWLNNGSGGFTFSNTFEGGVNGEYGMVAADMNNDGLPDLVVGGVNSNTVAINRNNGNGTFTVLAGATRAVGGGPWVIECGDINGDRRLDVTTANSGAATAATLVGNGNATVQAAVVKNVSGHCVATDLADVDGDGDLDWIVSCFGGNRWHLYQNNGSGIMTEFRQFPAPANPSCSVPADFDNDGDVDLALLDEIADVIVMMANVCPADFNMDNQTNPDDLGDYINCYFALPACDSADVNGDSEVNPDDLGDFINTYFGPEC